MAESKLSFMRYEKVRAVMESDPRLKKLLSKPNQWIGKQNQTGESFSKEVVDVTLAIDAAGLDACAMKPHQILHFATDMLVLKVQPPVVAKPQPASAEPVAEPAKEPEPPKATAKAKAKPRQKPTAKAESKKPAKPKPAPKAEAPVETPEPEVDAEPEAEAEPEVDHASGNGAATEPSKARQTSAKVGTVFKPTVTFIRRNIPFVPGVAMINQLYAVATILEPYASAGDAEAKELLDRVNELINLVHSKTVLPNCAQEDAKHG